jgi:hypothetical protein
VTIAPAIPADAEAVYHELLDERLRPGERAELARLLLDDGPPWADGTAERDDEVTAGVTLLVQRGASHGRSPKAEALGDHGSARNGFTLRPLRTR